MSSQEPDPSLSELKQELNRLHRSIRLTIERHLSRLEGTCGQTLETNQTTAASIHQLLDRYGLRTQCPECGNPAILRVSPRRGMARGVFVYDHHVNGKRTFHGGRSVFPAIKLVEKPPRKSHDASRS